MSNTAVSLRRKIETAGDLVAMVRTMKAIAASSITEYEDAVRSLDDYNKVVQLALLASVEQGATEHSQANQGQDAALGAVVFGSDQGLVGQFNDRLVEFTVERLAQRAGEKKVWAVGERIHARLDDSKLGVAGRFLLPSSINAITPLVGQVLLEMERQREQGQIASVYLFHNRLVSGASFKPCCQRLLPLDEQWLRQMTQQDWPSNHLPQVITSGQQTVFSFVREYLFVSLFRACAQSLASENACRLMAMQRAEKNIEAQLVTLTTDFHRLRQRAIDEELFDVVAGFEIHDR